MDVDRPLGDRPVVAEFLEPLDQPAHPVGFLADQLGQLPRLRIGAALDQLRRPADAGERVLDLVRQHRGEAGDRAGGAAMGELLFDPLGRRPLLQTPAARRRPRGSAGSAWTSTSCGSPSRGVSITTSRSLIGGAAGEQLLDDGDDRAGKPEQRVEVEPRQRRPAGLEEFFGGLVGVADATVGADQQHRIGQQIEDRLRVGEPAGARRLRRALVIMPPRRPLTRQTVRRSPPAPGAGRPRRKAAAASVLRSAVGRRTGPR